MTPEFEAGFKQAKEYAIALVQHARERGETDHRQMKAWIDAMKPNEPPIFEEEDED